MKQLMTLIEEMTPEKPSKFVYEPGDIQYNESPDEVVDEGIKGKLSPELDKFLRTQKVKSDTGHMVSMKYALSGTAGRATQRDAEMRMAAFRKSHYKDTIQKSGIKKAAGFEQNHPDEREKELLSAQVSIGRELSLGLMKVVRNYSTSGSYYVRINRALRTGSEKELKRSADVESRHTVGKYVQAMDAVFKVPSAKLRSPAVSYRGVSHHEQKRVSQLKPGETFTDKGFTSTTIDARQLDNFNKDVVLRFILPKGTKAIYLNAGKLSVEPNERELLLNRNQTYKVIGRHETVDDWGETALIVTVTLDQKRR